MQFGWVFGYFSLFSLNGNTSLPSLYQGEKYLSSSETSTRLCLFVFLVLPLCLENSRELNFIKFD